MVRAAPQLLLTSADGVSSGNWPTADKVSPFNRVLLAFWLTSGSHAVSYPIVIH